MNTTMVAIVRHTSECDVEQLPGTCPVTYDQAVEALRQMNRANPRQLRGIDLCTVQDDGTLGRYVSWAI